MLCDSNKLCCVIAEKLYSDIAYVVKFNIQYVNYFSLLRPRVSIFYLRIALRILSAVCHHDCMLCRLAMR